MAHGRPLTEGHQGPQAATPQVHVAVERIKDRSSMQRIVDTVVFGANNELCSRLPVGPYSPAVMRSSWEGDVELLRRGVTIAAIYQAESARTPEMLRAGSCRRWESCSWNGSGVLTNPAHR